MNAPTNGDGSEFTLGGLTFQITYIPGMNRIQLQLRVDDEWVLVHARNVPKDMTAQTAMQTMRRFVLGHIDQDEYNRRLPGN